MSKYYRLLGKKQYVAVTKEQDLELDLERKHWRGLQCHPLSTHLLQGAVTRPEASYSLRRDPAGHSTCGMVWQT